MTSDIKGRLEAHAMLLENQNNAIDGKDISDIRHSDGGLDLAKRVVNLKGASDWAVAHLREALAHITASERREAAAVGALREIAAHLRGLEYLHSQVRLAAIRARSALQSIEESETP